MSSICDVPDRRIDLANRRAFADDSGLHGRFSTLVVLAALAGIMRQGESEDR